MKNIVQKDRLIVLGLSALTLLQAPIWAQEDKVPFSVPNGFEAGLFARDPMLRNPVGLSVGANNTVYVTETQRRKAQNLDIRSNSDWIETELSLPTVASKKAFYFSTLTKQNSQKNKRRVQDLNNDGFHDWRDLTVLSEFVHSLKDIDGDGKADKAQVFADGFTSPVSGVAGGVLSWGNDVYVNVAPDIWKLSDTNGDGIADTRRSLAYGFANHIAYGGHNTHGATIGLDGRIYWSIGDTSSDYTPHEGAVFRCEPDGTRLEVFARGLRNPQEIVFDDFGNMFTGDNDADFGDRERWYYVVEGGDYGWRFWWQYQRGRNWKAPDSNYSVWMDEKLWHEKFPGQAAFIIPAIKLIDNGPCGMAAYPGVGMPEEFKNSFFLAHFTGSPANSGLRQYKVKSLGADFDLVQDKKVISGSVITGVDFAPDGSGLYFADWAGSWPLNKAGRVYRVTHPEYSQSDIVKQSFKLLNGGIDSMNPSQLKVLLSHENRNVRRESQFKLAKMGRRGRNALLDVLASDRPNITRLHALWGLDIVARKSPAILKKVTPFLQDPDPEIRAQVAKVCGDNAYLPSRKLLREFVKEEGQPARALYMAFVALGKMADTRALPDVLRVLEVNKDSDLMLRHAGIMYLSGTKDHSLVSELASHPSKDVRLAAVVALRKMENPHVAKFLQDVDSSVVLEAARAINDLPLEPARASLASILKTSIQSEALARRALNAHFRIGGKKNLESVVQYAINEESLNKCRVEAMRMIQHWENISPRDRVCGGWFPLAQPTHQPNGRVDNDVLIQVLKENLAGLLSGPEEVVSEGIKLVEMYDLNVPEPALINWVMDSEKVESLRLSALNLLVRNESPALSHVISNLLESNEPRIQSEVLVLLSRESREKSDKLIEEIVQKGSVNQLQSLIPVLPKINSAYSKKVLNNFADRLDQDRVPAKLVLEVVRSLEMSTDTSHQSKYKKWISQFDGPKSEQLIKKVAMSGGDKNAGASIFANKVELACIRCHQAPIPKSVNPTEGGTMGPNLTGLRGRISPLQMAESILSPNKEFAEGFEMVSISMNDDSKIFGKVIMRNKEVIVIELPILEASEDEFDFDESSSAEPSQQTIPLSDIKSIDKGISAMPPGLHHLMTLEEFRDLMAFLQSL